MKILKSAPRSILLLPFLIAAPALVLIATHVPKYLPNRTLMLVAAVGYLIGIVAWWRSDSAPKRPRSSDATAKRIANGARVAIGALDNKTPWPYSAAELDEVAMFYERWLNLEPDLRSRFREELSMEGIHMIRLGDALRYLR